MEIEFNAMDAKKQNLYRLMWEDSSKIPGEICKTWSKKGNKESNNSYAFEIPNISSKYLTTKSLSEKDIVTLSTHLIKIFDIPETESEQFKQKFKYACSGSGGEGAKITTLHSSSLCAFLFFYKVSPSNPLTFNINNKPITFDEVHFEIKNKVVSNPSNVDIVLVSHKNKILLYLESKFVEYYLSTGAINISTAYLKPDFSFSKKFYNTENLKQFGFESDFKSFKDSKGRDVFKLDSQKSKKTKCKSYVEGIKQMISHYIGLSNFVECGIQEVYQDKNDTRNVELKTLYEEQNYSIYLGEILFDFNDDKIKKYMDDYQDKYSKLNEFVSLNNKCPKIIFLEEPLHYSLFNKSEYNFTLDEKVKAFYFGNDSKK